MVRSTLKYSAFQRKSASMAAISADDRDFLYLPDCQLKLLSHTPKGQEPNVSVANRKSLSELISVVDLKKCCNNKKLNFFRAVRSAYAAQRLR